MKRDGRYGRTYWFGALIVVLSLAAFVVVAGIGTPASWGDDVGITLSLLMWPALIIYHFAWIAWHWSTEEQQPKKQT